MIEKLYTMGLGEPLYYVFHVLGYIAVLIFNVWYGKKYDVKPWKSILTTVIVYSVVYLWIYVQYWVESGFKVFGPNNIVRGFVYIPLFAFPVARLLKIKWSRMCDFIAPCVCVTHCISHIGCIFVGCCNGYPCSWGIYNPWLEQVVFPIQPVESLGALLIVVFLVWRAKKQQYLSDGLSFPLMLVTYGSTRFLFEFARDNEKILWKFSSLAFHALFMALVGLIAIIYIKKHGNRKELGKK